MILPYIIDYFPVIGIFKWQRWKNRPLITFFVTPCPLIAIFRLESGKLSIVFIAEPNLVRWKI